MTPALAEEIEQLLQGMHNPVTASLARWERLLRLARMSGLHGRLAATHCASNNLPDPVKRHLLSAARISGFNSQMLRAELHALARTCPADTPVIALKGSAYALQGLPMATGRFVSDVDLLVPRAQLRSTEERLRAAGWEATELDAYDERYYRDWSHETPPMRFPGSFLEVDLHHAITPVTGALRFDPTPLFESSEAVAGSCFRVLCAEDQVLHACVHCFQDGDLDLRVREIVDIDMLLRHFSERPNFWAKLTDRAQALGLARPLWYGLHFASTWMNTPMPVHALDNLPPPANISRTLMDALVPRAMLPSDPDFPPPRSVRLARTALLARYHWQRMPLRMLLPHLAHKAAMRAHARLQKKEATPGEEAGPR